MLRYYCERYIKTRNALQELNLPIDENDNRNDSHSHKAGKERGGQPLRKLRPHPESDLHVKLLFSQSPAYYLHIPPNFGHND